MNHIGTINRTPSIFRAITMLRVALVLGSVLMTFAIGAMAFGATWESATAGLVGFFLILWYAMMVEQSVDREGAAVWW